MRKLRFDKILEYVIHGEPNKSWYADNRATIENLFPSSDWDLVCDILAITSMNNTLEGNVTSFFKAYYQYKNDYPFTGFLPNVILHLEYRRDKKSFGGRKVANFAKALKEDHSAVVVDIWMLRAFGINDPGNQTPTKTEYDIIESYVTTNSLKFGMSPRQMQAAIWTGIRGRLGYGRPTKYCEVLRSKIIPCLFTQGTEITQQKMYIEAPF